MGAKDALHTPKCPGWPPRTKNHPSSLLSRLKFLPQSPADMLIIVGDLGQGSWGSEPPSPNFCKLGMMTGPIRLRMLQRQRRAWTRKDPVPGFGRNLWGGRPLPFKTEARMGLGETYLRKWGPFCRSPCHCAREWGSPLVLPPPALACRYKCLAASLPREMRRHTGCPSRLRRERPLSIGLGAAVARADWPRGGPWRVMDRQGAGPRGPESFQRA